MKRFTLRLEGYLHEKLRRESFEKNISMNDIISDMILDRYFGTYQVSEMEWVTNDGDYEISTSTGRPKVYHLGEPVNMDSVDVPDTVQELYEKLKEEL